MTTPRSLRRALYYAFLTLLLPPAVELAPSRAKPAPGLGLALSRDLARDMGGDLTLDGATGRGASFRLVLPADTRL